MKSILKYSVFIIALIALLFTNCSKETGPNHLPNLPELTRAPIPLFKPDASSDAFINVPSEFKGKFTIDLYFPDDAQARPTSCDIVVAMNKNYSNIRKLKSDITTFPTTIEVTGSDLAALFDLPSVDSIKGGNVFEVRAAFSMPDGSYLRGFADGIDANTASSDINNFPGSQTSITYDAVCPMVLDNYLGNMTVEDPFFWEDSYPVVVTLESPGVLKVDGINGVPGDYMLINFDPATFIASVDNRVIAPTASYFPYTNLTAEGNGKIDGCDNAINLTLDWNVDQGGFGAGEWHLHK